MKMPQWGLGKVINIINQELSEVFFEHSGYHTFYRKNNPLSEPDSSDIDTTIFDNLSRGEVDEEKKNSYQDLPFFQEHFLREFPGGFEDPKYIHSERLKKDEGHAYAFDLLNQKSFENLIQTKNFEEVCTRALKVANKLNLLCPSEKRALCEGLKEDSAKEEFAHTLFALLHGSDEFKNRFERWRRSLESIDADKWGIATCFLFLLFPDRYMFVKPNVIQAVADRSAFNIAFAPRPNWRTYEKILAFSEYIKQKLHRIGPKDMIDVQSFMCCISTCAK